MLAVAGRHLLLVCCLAAAIGTAVAQPNAEVYWDDNNRADTVMDFGVTLEGYPVTLPFIVRNNGATPAGILQTNPNADPYYQIVNTSDVAPSDPRKEEFVRVEDIPYVIAPFTADTFHVVYRALKNNPVFPPDSVSKALLEIRVVSMDDTLGLAVFKRFLLLALKTRFSVASNKPVIRFDSVYVNPVPLPPTQVYTAVNASSIAIPVERQTLVYVTSVVSDRELVVDTLAHPVFAPHKGLTWNVRYQPHNMGFDSAEFSVVYRPNTGSDPDSVTTRLSGIGVAQNITIDAANGIPPPVVVARGTLADTIDFGDVDADGTGGKLAKIVVKNSGNIHVRYTSEQKQGAQADTAAFIVERTLQEGGADLRTNELDTLLVRFKPIRGGLHVIRYVVLTNLLDRKITGVPDGAEQKVFVLRGFARKPQALITPQQVDFGAVVLNQNCLSAVERTIQVRNVGNIILRIDSSRIEPLGAAVTVEPSDPFPPVGVDSTLTLTVRYQPTQIETLQGKLVLYTNAFGPPVTITLTGSSVDTDSLSVSLPITKARPGSILQLPIRVDASKVSLAKTSSITITFDPSLLRYRGVITAGTAAEGSSILQQTESPRGTLVLQLHATGSFLPRDTFAVATFDTFLGNAAATELSMKNQTTMFGNDGCTNIFTVHAESGRFDVDSVCGLEYKTSTAGVLRLTGWPNPTAAILYVNLENNTQSEATVTVYDSYGTAQPCEYRSHIPGFDLSTLPAGAYLVVARSQHVFARMFVVKQ